MFVCEVIDCRNEGTIKVRVVIVNQWDNRFISANHVLVFSQFSFSTCILRSSSVSSIVVFLPARSISLIFLNVITLMLNLGIKWGSRNSS